ncbi:MAG: NAD(+)/NADH kinase [Myxococcota bacterium]|nr:NAD(+)/NADH kinase [Myxococcota bacterium]
MRVAKALLIAKKTPLTTLRQTHARDAKKFKKLLEAGHASVKSFERAHDEHAESLKIVRRELRSQGVKFSERNSPPSKPISGVDLVICVGGDGTLLRASHAVRNSIPVLGVNSAPAYSVGFLTCCRAPTFARRLDDLASDRITPLEIQRLVVRVGRRRIPEPVLNDVLFCHDNPAVTTRYRILTPEGEELQRSSGIWIATPAGSTAAIRSAGGTALPLTDTRFEYIVREPYAPPGSTVELTGGILDAKERLAVECRSQSASIYIDGSHRSYKVPFGTKVSFTLTNRPLRLVAHARS